MSVPFLFTQYVRSLPPKIQSIVVWHCGVGYQAYSECGHFLFQQQRYGNLIVWLMLCELLLYCGVNGLETSMVVDDKVEFDLGPVNFSIWNRQHWFTCSIGRRAIAEVGSALERAMMGSGRRQEISHESARTYSGLTYLVAYAPS